MESRRALEGMGALVTGGARNIGFEIAKTLASKGASVAVADLCDDLKTIPYKLSSADDLNRSMKEISELGSKVLGLTCDVRVESQVKALMDEVIGSFGQLDILINNAGVSSLVPIEKLSEEAWNEVVDVCLKGTYLCCKHAISHMIERRSGKIVNIASVAGLRGLGYSVHYCAAKHGVVGLTRALAVEVADHNINVNAICPGTVESPILKGLALQVDLSGDPYEHFSQGHLLQNRRITPEDIARTALWLVTEESRPITGTVVTVDAGWTAQA
jgi:NAD(P)-dependent dehydrogenase (short-subunit alcohol dehydrogenase family)